MGFFQTVQETNFVFDPKIVYDIHTSTFNVVALDGDTKKCVSNILSAVSTNNNPTPGDWRFARIGANSIGNWVDYSGFEVDEEVIYITGNMFTCGVGFQFSKLWIVEKGTLKANEFANFAGFQEGTNQPAAVRASTGAGQTIGTYLVAMNNENFSDQRLSITQIKNPTGIASFERKFVS